MSVKKALLLAFFVTIFTVGMDLFASKYFMAVTIFYLFPVVLVAWHTDKKIAIPVALINGVLEISIRYCYLLGEINHYVLFWNIIIKCIVNTCLVILVSKLVYSYKKEQILSRVDFLTGIPNWMAFSEILEREKQRAIRYKQNISLAYIDCDNFKKVNDEYGHQEGNKVLSLVASTMTNCIRKTDYAARIGGDEFAILLTEASPEDAKKVIKKVKDILIAEMKSNDFPVTFSMGVATFENPPESIDEMVKISDLLMNDVKSSTKNNIKHEVFHEGKDLCCF